VSTLPAMTAVHVATVAADKLTTLTTSLVRELLARDQATSPTVDSRATQGVADSSQQQVGPQSMLGLW